MKDTYITYILLIVAVLAITYVVSLKTKEGMENRQNLVFVNEEGAYDLGNRGRPLQLFSKKPSTGSYGTPGSGTGVAARPVLPGQGAQVSTGKPDNSGVLSVPLIADPTETLQDLINKGVLAGLQQGAKDRYSNLTPPTDTPPTDTPPTDTPPTDTPPTDTPPTYTPPTYTPPTDTPPKDTPPTDTPPTDTAKEAQQLEADIQEQQDKNKELVSKLSGYKAEVNLKKESRENTFIEDYVEIEAKKNEIVNNINTIDGLWNDIKKIIEEGNLEVSELPDNYNDLQTQVERLKQLKTDTETIFNNTVSLKTEYDDNSDGEPNSTLGSIENFETLNELKAFVNANQEIVTAYDNWKKRFLSDSRNSQLDRMNTEIDSKLNKINELKIPQDLQENLETLKINVVKKVSEKAKLDKQQIEQLLDVQKIYQDQLNYLVKNENTKAIKVNSARSSLTFNCKNIKINVDDITKLQEVINDYNSLKLEIEDYKNDYKTFSDAQDILDSEIQGILYDYDEEIKTFGLPIASTNPYTIEPPEIAKPPTAFTKINACQVGNLLKPIKDAINTYLKDKKKGINSTISTALADLAISDITLNKIVIALENINPKITFLEKIDNGNLPLDEDNNITIQLSYLEETIGYRIDDNSDFNYVQLNADLSGVQTELKVREAAILNKQEQERIQNTPIFQTDFLRSPGGYVSPTGNLGTLKTTPIECNITGAPEGAKGKISLLQGYGFYGFDSDGINPGTNKFKYKTKCAINVGQTRDPVVRQAKFENGQPAKIDPKLTNIVSRESFDGWQYRFNCNFVDASNIDQKGIISEIFLDGDVMKYKCVFPEENVYSEKSGRPNDDEIIIDSEKDIRYSNVKLLKDTPGGTGYIQNLGSGSYSPNCPNKTYLSYTHITNTNPHSTPRSIQYQYKCMGRKKDLDAGSRGRAGGNLNEAEEAAAAAAARKARAKAANCLNWNDDPWKNGGVCSISTKDDGRDYGIITPVWYAKYQNCYQKSGNIFQLGNCARDNASHYDAYKTGIWNNLRNGHISENDYNTFLADWGRTDKL